MVACLLILKLIVTTKKIRKAMKSTFVWKFSVKFIKGNDRQQFFIHTKLKSNDFKMLLNIYDKYNEY